MRVRAKVTVVLTMLFAILIASQWAIQQNLILPRFVELERDSAHTDMQRVALAVEREQQALGAQAADWGNWQQLWDYMRDANQAFVKASLTDASFMVSKIDYMAVVDTDGHYRWRHGPYSISGKASTIHLNKNDELEPAWMRALTTGAATNGLITTDAGVLIAAGAPILDGFGQGPARGMIIMGRLLNPAELLHLGTQAQVTLDMRPWGQDRGSDQRLLAASSSGSEYLSESPSTTRIERAFANLSGVPLLSLGIAVPRNISQRGADVVKYSTHMLAIAAGIVLATLLLLLGRIVLSPLARVTDHAERIAAADDLSARLRSARQDELGTLANAIDNMVERLAASRRELIERSFESGAAENASGVLHNLGNAVTPLSVNIADLRRLFNTAHLDDLQLALEELRHGSPDAERLHDLQQFVQLSAADMAQTLQHSNERLRQITAQTEVIQAVLAEQRNHRRSGPVLQSVVLSELITGSLDHIAPVHRAQLALQMGPDIAALPPLILPCTTLSMVLQNLAQNAAEAALQAGLPRTRLQVAADIIDWEGQQTLRLRVSDDATGVAAEDLPKLFRKGFSTKPQATNSGLGLHWCANALHALGGRIVAHSAGPGTGTSFEIHLPLNQASAQHEERAA
jgi:sensor domain CHASE-containing protein